MPNTEVSIKMKGGVQIQIHNIRLQYSTVQHIFGDQFCGVNPDKFIEDPGPDSRSENFRIHVLFLKGLYTKLFSVYPIR